MRVKQEKETSFSFYQDNYDHLTDELRKLDLLIQSRVITLRLETEARQRATASQQTYISHEAVDWLLTQNGVPQNEPAELIEGRYQLTLQQDNINTKVAESIKQGAFLALPQLAHLFSLSPFELQAIMICLAPELQRKYDKLYAYLQDDITRKKPSIDLVLDLLCETAADKWAARTFFSDSAPLFRAEILQTADDPQSPSGSSGLARFLKLDARILNYILGNNNIDGRIQSLVKLLNPEVSMESIPVDPAIKTRLLNLVQHHFAEQKVDRQKLVLYFHGPYGGGKRDLALGLCGQLNCPLLYLDMELFLVHDSNLEAILRLVFREGLLLQAALYLDNVEVLLREDDKARASMKKLAHVIAEYGWLVFLAGEKPWSPPGIFEHTVFQAVELPVPNVPLREAAWEKALASLMPGVATPWARQLASQFRLTPGQIQDAGAFVENRRAMGNEQAELCLADLYTACRRQSNQTLGELALKIEPRYGWADIILPEDKLTQLKEICAQVKHRYRVFNEWGFEEKLSYGKGLSVLFTGPPGTGKTMAAQVIAHELRLDLYKVDLSGVVSKYIGETEKNLARIFAEAETSNAILFFDEADALFGKRTEVSDAHDRYANIETSYLLQKMEEYEGVVILATNLRENMDEAFTRRIRFIVEFPFPNATSREMIWRTHFPQQAPVSKALDYAYLAKQFQITGGNIKNIALNAAFLAAENGQVIGMEHLLHGTQREYEKMGKSWQAPKLKSKMKG